MSLKPTASVSLLLLLVARSSAELARTSGAVFEKEDVEPELCMLQVASHATKSENQQVQLLLQPNSTSKGSSDVLSGSTANGSSKRYLMVLAPGEQLAGAVDFIADALHFAKAQNRVFVEPVLTGGLVVDPFENDDWIPLSMLVDVAAMKEYYADWINVEDFLQLYGGRGSAQKPGEDVMEALNATPDYDRHAHKYPQLDDAMIKSLEPKRDTPVLALVGQWCRLSYITSDHSWTPTRSLRGVQKLPSPYIAELADRVKSDWQDDGAAGQILCAQWRSEGAVRLYRKECPWLDECASDFLKGVKSVQQQHNLSRVLLLSDVLPNTSATYLQCSTSRERIESKFQQEMDFRTLQQPLKDIKDAALRAQVEARLCAKSTAVLICSEENPGPHCSKCARLQSKFAASIIEERRKDALSEVITW
mmetsp:Transcript_112141/g.203832  ORF Transcript_112141/g.203832 Transcript_112141/m.203832 type:complete len:420 (-) Transcript_112141:39-1298(-)